MEDALKQFREEVQKQRDMAAAAVQRFQTDADANRGVVAICDRFLASLDEKLRAAQQGDPEQGRRAASGGPDKSFTPVKKE